MRGPRREQEARDYRKEGGAHGRWPAGPAAPESDGRSARPAAREVEWGMGMEQVEARTWLGWLGFGPFAGLVLIIISFSPVFHCLCVFVSVYFFSSRL